MIDRDLWDYFDSLQVNPQYYSLRWLMLMLTQEFRLNDVLRLWDTLLSHPNMGLYLNYLCLAILINLKKQLIESDFA